MVRTRSPSPAVKDMVSEKLALFGQTWVLDGVSHSRFTRKSQCIRPLRVLRLRRERNCRRMPCVQRFLRGKRDTEMTDRTPGVCMCMPGQEAQGLWQGGRLSDLCRFTVVACCCLHFDSVDSAARAGCDHACLDTGRRVQLVCSCCHHGRKGNTTQAENLGSKP